MAFQPICRCLLRKEIFRGAPAKLIRTFFRESGWRRTLDVMLVNRDQQNAHRVRIVFEGPAERQAAFAGAVEVSTFGSAQYQWHPAQTRFMAHAENSGQRTIVPTTKGWADPDGPIAHSKLNSEKNTMYDLPAASIVVVQGNIGKP